MLVLAGKKDEASQLLTDITSKDTPHTRPYFVALAYTALGDPDGAFAALDRSLNEQDNWIAWMKVDPRLDPLRGDARFDEILVKGNFK